MPEDETIGKAEDLVNKFDLEMAALNAVARHFAGPLLLHEYMSKYANDSGLNALLSVPKLPTDIKKQIILTHLKTELTKALKGVGDKRLPGVVSEIVAEEWCHRLPLPLSGDGDWIDALNSALGPATDNATEECPKTTNNRADQREDNKHFANQANTYIIVTCAFILATMLLLYILR
jgi:hypothetical protein